jgi:hypothetical protein
MRFKLLWFEIIINDTRLDKERSCGSKVKYGHFESAEKACITLREKKGRDLQSYKCRYCEGWHIGHGL